MRRPLELAPWPAAAALLLAGVFVAHAAPCAESVRYGPAGAPRIVRLTQHSAGLFAVEAGRSSGWSFLARSGRFVSAAAATDPEPCRPTVAIARGDTRLDGFIDAADGDTALAVFAVAGAAGSTLHALDVSDPSAPRLAWTAGARELPALGIVSTPPAGASLAAAPGGTPRGRTHRPIVVLGTGAAPPPGPALASGGAAPPTFRPDLLVLDAASGQLLWSMADNGPQLLRRALRDEIRAPPVAIDLDGDGHVDRVYALDVGGRLFRLDLWPQRGAAALVTGGVLAHLGDLGSGDGDLFFNEGIDVALIEPLGTAPYLNLSASAHGTEGGSGWFFAVRDRDPFARWEQQRYEAYRPLAAHELPIAGVAGASSPADAPGWRLALGARTAGAALTADGIVWFTSVAAGAGESASCTAPRLRQVHALDIETGAPALDLDSDGRIEDADVELEAPTRDAQVQIVLDEAGGRAICRVGEQTLAACIPAPALSRTWWLRGDVQ